MKFHDRTVIEFQACASGGVNVTFAFLLIIFMGVIGLSVDYGIWVNRRFELQAMADKAALEGVAELNKGTIESAEAKAKLSIVQHGGTTGPIKMKIDPAAHKVGVDLSEKAPRFFSIFYLASDPKIGVTSEATALKAKGRLCALALDRTANPGIHMNGDGILTGPECIVWTNSQTGNAIKVEKSASATLKRFCAVGGASNSSKGVVIPAPEADCAEQPDPYSDFSLPIPTGCDHTKFNSSAPVVYLSPGTYCDGITIASDRVIAAPGIYYLKNGIVEISGTSDVSFENSTIYMSGTKVGITLKGDSSLRITAPEIGPSASIAVAIDPDATPAKASVFAGSSEIYISGTLHMPQSTIKISGDSVGIAELSNALLIGSNIEFGGGAKWIWTAVEKLPEIDDGAQWTLSK
jgi:Putative Flp pilus-assembly TadE/G-like